MWGKPRIRTLAPTSRSSPSARRARLGTAKIGQTPEAHGPFPEKQRTVTGSPEITPGRTNPALVTVERAEEVPWGPEFRLGIQAPAQGAGMSALDLLGTAIGIVALYLLFALLCTATQELLQVWLKYRARDLRLGIRRMLGDQGAKEFYTNPLIFSLFGGNYSEKSHRNLPSYIPTKLFAQALFSNIGAVAAVSGTPDPAPLAGMRSTVDKLTDSTLKGALLKLIDDAGGDLSRLQGSVELWYDSNMDRVSGMYKRSSTVWLFCIGILIATFANFDSISMTRYIALNPNAQQALINIATEIASQPLPPSGPVTSEQIAACRASPVADACPEPYRSLESLENGGLPIGWKEGPPGDGITWFLKILGLVVTAIALSLGAPFWFDLLNKLMVLRATVKPTEKSPPEKSND